LESQEHNPWGKVRSGGIAQTTLNYTGQRLDGTGLLYYHARYYDPNLARFISPDNIVPDTVSGIEKNSRLTVDFHERSLLGSINSENFLTLHKGFWFQLSNTERQKYEEPWGPQNPQALNRYAYVLNNPTQYKDPNGHDGEVINHSSYPIIVVGVKDGKGTVAVVWPGESSKKYMPDADFWRPVDGDPATWMKVGENIITVEDSTDPKSSSGLRYKSRCTALFCSDSGPWEWGKGPFEYVTCGEKESECRKDRPRSCFLIWCNDSNDYEEYPWYQMRACTPGDTSTWCEFAKSDEYRRAVEENSRSKKSRSGR
jgi:RHS repeat-associated protein